METQVPESTAPPQQPPARRIQRVRHELKRRDLDVVRVERASANFVSVTFGGASLADFVSESFDDHVKFMFTDPAGELVRRDYTPRAFDRQALTLTIEFALHGHGPASEWARLAAAGQRVTIGGPRGSMIIPADYDWHLLVGDATALPAIRRRLAELPAEARVQVIAQVADAAERVGLSRASRFDLQWVASVDELVAVLRQRQLPAGDGFIWCAGEASEMARLRELVLAEMQHPREATRIAAYWKRGASEFHENLAA